MSEPLPDRQILDNLLTRLGDAEQIMNTCQRDLHSLRHDVNVARGNFDFDQKHSVTGIVPLDILEQRAVYEAISVCGGDKVKAAQRLGIGKTTLYRKLKEYEVGVSA
jgi:two-component system response regulator HydG